MDENKLLFSDIKFIIAQCFNTNHIRNLLIEGGAKHINYLSEHVTLVLSDTHCSEAEEAVELFDKPVVSSLWVHLSIKAKKLLPTEAFSPFKAIFQNVVASFSSNFSKNDIDILASTLTFHGARVTKDIATSTHHIVPDPTSCDLIDQSLSGLNLKIVAPDWVLESVKLKCCCDESLFGPEYLLPPPPPTPTPPPPSPPKPAAAIQAQEKETSANQPKPDAKPIETKSQFGNCQPSKSPPQTTLQRVRPQQIQPRPPLQNHQQVQQQFSQHAQSQINHQAQPVQTMPQSHLPRPQGMPQNIIRGVQPKFRPLLPPDGNPTPVQQQHPRGVVPDSQQPKKVSMNFGPQYRKPVPYQNNFDPQQQQTQIQQPSAYGQAQAQQQPQSHQLVSVQQQPGANATPSRLPQPTLYSQVRGNFQNSHMPPRGPNQPAQQQMVNSQQPTQMINRFQDPNAPINQRPYQVCLQPQGVRSNYQPNNMPRPIYYTQQGSNQVQVRMPQQGTPVRHAQNEQIVYENFNSSQQTQDSMSTQQHYQGHPPQQPFNNSHQQPQPQQFQPPPQHHSHGQIQIRGPGQPSHQVQSQPPPMPHGQQQMQNQFQNLQNTGSFQPNFIRGGPGPQHVRAPRGPFVNQQNPQKLSSARHLSPEQLASQQGPRMSDSNQPHLLPVTRPQQQMQPQVRLQSQPQPHPSIFDHIQESNLAQIKAEVPIVNETFDYFGHDPKDVIPKNHPLSGCKFRLIEYEEVNSKMKRQWLKAIKIAGGVIRDDLEGLTHLICETRLTETFSEAIKLGIRCVTIYWINDVLALNRLAYPWKALHFPLSFARDNRPLTSHIISTTNFKGKNRREVREMIIKTGASYTDYFSNSNSLLVCGNVGGEKYEHALEWRIPIANCQILSDILLNSDKNLDIMLSQSKYQLFNQTDSFKLASYSGLQDLMKPWKQPISITDQENNQEEGDRIEVDKLEITEVPEVTQASEDTTISRPRCPRKSNGEVRVLFTHLKSDLVEKLTSFASELGFSIASGPATCTHLVVDSISRTPKFICAFNYAKFIVSHTWIIESHEFGSLLDEKQFILRDQAGEEAYSFNLVYSLLKRKKRRKPLFNNMVFFITPGLLESTPGIKEMVESAGGVVATKKLPSRLQISQMKLDGKRFVVVSSKEDLHLCSSLVVTSVDIVDAEFIISGILRQDIDFEAHRLKNITRPHDRQSNFPKKLRIEEST